MTPLEKKKNEKLTGKRAHRDEQEYMFGFSVYFLFHVPEVLLKPLKSRKTVIMLFLKYTLFKINKYKNLDLGNKKIHRT